MLTLHVSPAGSDDHPGTADRPIRTLGELGNRLTERSLVTEVIFHKGVYSGGLNIPPLNDAAPASTLLIRAAEGEEVIFDGAGRLVSSYAVVD